MPSNGDADVQHDATHVGEAGEMPQNPYGPTTEAAKKQQEEREEEGNQRPSAPYGDRPQQGYPAPPQDWQPQKDADGSLHAYPGDNYVGGAAMGQPLPPYMGEPKHYRVARTDIHGYLVSQEELPNGDIRTVYQEHLSNGIIRQTTAIDKTNRIKDKEKASLGLLGVCLLCCCCCPNPW
ncbi:hypothetical protein DIPPA_08925 [Diplonema papillatum]|nr:hypothetical protein DIPPA_08925 [Diplonema papillatum]